MYGLLGGASTCPFSVFAHYEIIAENNFIMSKNLYLYFVRAFLAKYTFDVAL